MKRGWFTLGKPPLTAFQKVCSFEDEENWLEVFSKQEEFSLFRELSVGPFASLTTSHLYRLVLSEVQNTVLVYSYIPHRKVLTEKELWGRKLKGGADSRMEVITSQHTGL